MVLVIALVQQSIPNTNLCSSSHYIGDESLQICKFEANDNISWYHFCLGHVSKYFSKDEQSEISLNGTVYDFSIDYS